MSEFQMTIHSFPAVLSTHCRRRRVHWNFVIVRFDWYFTRLNFLFQLNSKKKKKNTDVLCNACTEPVLGMLRHQERTGGTPDPAPSLTQEGFARPAVCVYPAFSYPSLHLAVVCRAIHVQYQGCQHRGGFILFQFFYLPLVAGIDRNIAGWWNVTHHPAKWGFPWGNCFISYKRKDSILFLEVFALWYSPGESNLGCVSQYH